MTKASYLNWHFGRSDGGNHYIYTASGKFTYQIPISQGDIIYTIRSGTRGHMKVENISSLSVNDAILECEQHSQENRLTADEETFAKNHD